MKYTVGTACVSLFLAACAPSADTSAEATASASTPLAAEDSPMPTGASLPRTAAGIAAANNGGETSSWEEYVALQAPSDQEYLEDLEGRYFGAVAFETAEEREYMVRAGFPSPEEWLEAKRMTDAQLQEKADGGDPKAAGMLADRMSVRLGELLELSQVDRDAAADADRARLASLAVAYSSQAMDGSRSPFGLYVEGMVKSSIFNSWEPMTAAMLEAMNRGDPRVDRLIRELQARHPEQNVEAIQVALRGMKQQYP